MSRRSISLNNPWHSKSPPDSAIYDVTAKTGEGGMGKVYRARDTTLDRQMALKICGAKVLHWRSSGR